MSHDEDNWTLADLIEEFTPLLDPVAGPLDAELAGADFLATSTEDLPADEAAELLIGLIEEVAEYGGPAAVAMLRAVAAAAGPEPVRAAATTAADRLVADGLDDPAWAAQVGSPTVGPCFGYLDDAGEHTLVAQFQYGSDAHAFVVLLDEAEGGVRDVWVTDRPDELLADFRGDPLEYGTETAHDLASVRALLAPALTQPPSPVEPDEQEDVAIHLDLLRRRVALI